MVAYEWPLRRDSRYRPNTSARPLEETREPTRSVLSGTLDRQLGLGGDVDRKLECSIGLAPLIAPIPAEEKPLGGGAIVRVAIAIVLASASRSF